MILDETPSITILEYGKQYKFLGVLQSVLSDHNRVTASNQFALSVLGYLMWTQQWPIVDVQ